MGIFKRGSLWCMLARWPSIYESKYNSNEFSFTINFSGRSIFSLKEICFLIKKRNLIMKSTTKKLVSCALCIALGVLLPMAFHVIPNGGSVFFTNAYSCIDLWLILWSSLWFGMRNYYTIFFKYDNRNASSHDFAPNDD